MNRVLMVDNYDSFTYNLVQAFLVTGVDVVVEHNDDISPADADDIDPTHIVISPGPGHPEDAGASVEIIRHFAGRVPILGVCLGHQAIGVAFGGQVDPAMSLMHGKSSQVYHDQRTLFAGLPNPFVGGRYHSLAISDLSLPDELAITAHTSDGEIMGIRHESMAVEGVQFHPESVLTPVGERLISNFLGMNEHHTDKQMAGVAR